MIPLIDRDRFDPVRQVNWRWRRVCQYMQSGSRLTALRADDAVSSVVQYLRKRNRLKTLDGRSRFERKYSHLTDALAFAGGTCRQRAILQAGILSGESAEISGGRVGLSGPAVDAFEALFFNVRDRLAARCWILTAAVNQADGERDDECRRLRLLRRLAYRGGPYALELALSAFGLVECAICDVDCERRIRLLEAIESANLSLFELVDLLEISTPQARVSVMKPACDLSILERIVLPELPLDARPTSSAALDHDETGQHLEAA